jgi:hypothetical protein
LLLLRGMLRARRVLRIEFSDGSAQASLYRFLQVGRVDMFGRLELLFALAAESDFVLVKVACLDHIELHLLGLVTRDPIKPTRRCHAPTLACLGLSRTIDR